MPAEYRLEDDKYSLFMQAATLKMTEEGLENSPENFVRVLQDWWYILQDEAAVAAYVEEKCAAEKIAHKAQLEAALAALEE